MLSGLYRLVKNGSHLVPDSRREAKSPGGEAASEGGEEVGADTEAADEAAAEAKEAAGLRVV